MGTQKKSDGREERRRRVWGVGVETGGEGVVLLFLMTLGSAPYNQITLKSLTLS